MADRDPHPGARHFPLTRDYYPAASGKLGESGKVTVNACIDENGKLTERPTVVESSGSPRLDEAAVKMATAGSGHYLPTLRAGKPVAMCFKFRIAFDSRAYPPKRRGEPE